MKVYKISYNTILILLMLYGHSARAQENAELFEPGTPVVRLAGDFAFTEGPAADRKGNVYFTDQPNNKIWIWTIKGELVLFTDESGRSNGLYLDEQDRVLACADMDNELWRFDHDANPEVLVSGYEGKLLNGPNDLWIRPDGKIYFTDPLYAREYWMRDPASEQQGQFIYFYDADHQESLKPVVLDFVRPNGLIGDPDKKLLYVADIGDSKIYSYRYRKNGKLKKRKLFADMGSDGMTIDEHGNIYLTGKGVTVFNPAGEKISHIPVPEGWTANVCFGGENRDTLFITASTGLYALKMNVKGMRRF